MPTIDSAAPSHRTPSVSRRGALALGAAASASALLLGGRTASASVRTGGGIAGGGWVTWETGEAQFSVFGSRFVDDEADEPVILGSFIWADAAGFTLTSEQIDGYGPVEPTETSREMVGYVRNSDGGTLHSFTLRLVDGGGPGEQLDMVSLSVGPALSDDATPADAVAPAMAMISVEAPIEVGDLQLLTFEFPSAESAVTVPKMSGSSKD